MQGIFKIGEVFVTLFKKKDNLSRNVKMVENGKIEAQVKMCKIQVLMDSNREIYVLLHFLTVIIIGSKLIISLMLNSKNSIH